MPRPRAARRVLGALLCAALVLAACGGRGNIGALRAPRAAFLGVNVQYVLLAPPAVRVRQLDAIERAGIGFVRSDAPWELAEPFPPANGRHSYNWVALDSIEQLFAERRLRWLPIIGYSAAWASISPPTTLAPPARVADYAAYAGAFAARYGPGGAFWREHPSLPQVPITQAEIWNEPNTAGFWPPAPNATAYAHLYAMASDAIHAANSGVTPVVGGLAQTGNTDAFLGAMLAAAPQLRGAITAVALHPYAPAAGGAQAEIVALRHALNSDGLARAAILVTEMGWPIKGGNEGFVVSEAERARDLSESLTLAARSGCGVTAFAVYSWTTPELDPANSEHWFGIYSPTAQPSPSAAALIATANKLNLASRLVSGPPGPC